MRSARSLNSDRPIIADKRAAILRAAIRVFAHNGYFNSKVADIASAAGVADGTVYLYFKSKEEILHSIFDRSMEEAIAAGKKQLEQITDPREKLRRIALLHLERLGDDRDLAVVFQVELRGSTKFMEEFSAAGFAEYLARKYFSARWTKWPPIGSFPNAATSWRPWQIRCSISF